MFRWHSLLHSKNYIIFELLGEHFLFSSFFKVSCMTFSMSDVFDAISFWFQGFSGLASVENR